MRVYSCSFVAIVLLLSLCSCGRDNSIVVGSKNFTEQLILGEIAAQQLERKLHVKVSRKLNLGGTLLTGPSGVATSSLNLGKNSLLGE